MRLGTKMGESLAGGLVMGFDFSVQQVRALESAATVGVLLTELHCSDKTKGTFVAAVFCLTPEKIFLYFETDFSKMSFKNELNLFRCYVRRNGLSGLSRSCCEGMLQSRR